MIWISDTLSRSHNLASAQIREPQVLHFDDGLLAQEVIHPQDLVLVEDGTQPGVEFARRVKIVAERLFERDARVFQQPDFREVLDNRREQCGRHFQIEERMMARTNPVGQRTVKIVIGDVAVQIRQSAGQPVEDRIIDLFAGVRDGLPRPLDQFFDRHVVTGHPQDRAVQQVAALQAVQGAEGHLAGQITGNSEYYQQV